MVARTTASPLRMPRGAVWIVACAAVCAVGVGGCATIAIDPALYDAQSFALASVYARRDVWIEGPGTFVPMLDNELGAEVIEMSLGDTEADLARLFAVDEVVPLKVAQAHKASHALPEAQPVEEWSQLPWAVSVDTDPARSAPALGRLAAALGVDAAIVLRHEWSLGRDRVQPMLGMSAAGLTAYDRCTILVVDARGRTLLSDTVLTSAPFVAVGVEPRMFGVHAVGFSDEIRALARRTGRACLDLLKRRIAQERPARAVVPRKG